MTIADGNSKRFEGHTDATDRRRRYLPHRRRQTLPYNRSRQPLLITHQTTAELPGLKSNMILVILLTVLHLNTLILLLRHLHSRAVAKKKEP
uniref:Uncharacterized protein n=1 Tax=Syphacia muris TaxID=451379 RepID=A0A0N5AXI4_9BILA